jgi:hypothetical protein
VGDGIGESLEIGQESDREALPGGDLELLDEDVAVGKLGIPGEEGALSGVRGAREDFEGSQLWVVREGVWRR